MIKKAYQQLNVVYEIVKKVTLISDSPRAGNLRKDCGEGCSTCSVHTATY